MGSFWGPNDTMKESAGFPREYANWNYQQYKDWLANQNAYSDRGDYASGQAYDYWNNLMNTGMGSPQSIRATGQTIMPGVDEAVATQQARLQNIINQYQSLPKTADTMAVLNDAQNQLASLVSYTGDANTAEIGDTASRAFGRETAASTAINADLLDRYHQLGLDVERDYGAMRGTNRSVYGELGTSAEKAYADAQAEVEKLRPGSEFKQAEAARSFAGEAAATAGRLRRAGLSSTSPQAMSAMQRVESSRARAMDDAAAEGTAEYVKSRNALTLGEQANRQGLRASELGNELTLAGQQSGLSRDLSLQQGEGLRGETARHLTSEQAIDRDRSTRQTAENTANYGRTTDYLNTVNQNALLERGMAREDWDTQSNLEREQTAADLNAINLRNMQFAAGMNYTGQNLNAQNTGAQGVTNYGNQQTQNAFNSARTALGFGDTAAQNYATAYGYNAPKAGYGAKMIASAAAPALAAIPGVGPYLAMGAQAASGQYPGSGTYGQGGGYNTQGYTTQGYGGQGNGAQGGYNPQAGGYGTQQGGGYNPYSALGAWKKLNAAIWNRNPYQQGSNQGTGE